MNPPNIKGIHHIALKANGLPATPPYPARIAFVRGPLGEEVEFFSER